MNEIWKPVPGWESLYEVSDQGRVRSLPRERLIVHGRKRIYGGKVIAGCPDRRGYTIVNLRDSETGRHTTMKMHSLVLLAFVGPRPEGLQGCHENDIKHDNRLINLRWGTPISNGADKVRNGRSLTGEMNPFSKLTERQVAEILKAAEPTSELAARYGVTTQCIRGIQKGRSWQAFVAMHCEETV